MTTIVVTGGGTGGHLSVAKSFIEELYKRDIQIIFIGSTKGADKNWFNNYDKIYKTYFLDTRGVVNQNFIGKIVSLWMIIKAIFKIKNIYKKYNVSKVISVGGFSAAPASLAAILKKTDFYIHEQNSIMGKLNKITFKYSKAVFNSYDKTSLVKDYPINNRFFKAQRVRKNIKTIIFLGGSQGARSINNFAIKVAPILTEKNIKIIHQTGKLDFLRVEQKYQKLGIKVDIFDFSSSVIKKMNKADFAVSRSGASTLWELSALGIPTLYIPYPYATENHQYFNAKFLYDEKLCFLEIENQLNENIIIKILDKDISKISEKLISSINKNGVQKIIDSILELN
jgi:UDP-N-acetylglucosamine--N-acetylmuramyl-(pentapeptide) pyrophosphoryl-undecaprenol N-acetylglucosamine transferase